MRLIGDFERAIASIFVLRRGQTRDPGRSAEIPIRDAALNCMRWSSKLCVMRRKRFDLQRARGVGSGRSMNANNGD